MARGTGTVTVKFLGDVSDLKKKTDDAEGALGKVGSAVGGMAKTAAMVGIPALVGFGVAAVKAFAESEQVAAQTEAVLKSTGGAAKITADHVGDLAGSLSKLSGVDDEVIQSGENVLLTFTNIRNATGKNNDIFDRATKTALDMSVALGTDLQSANIQLGKALNDPIKGITALTRVGVSFTDKQKDQIKTLVESGKTMEAQKIILGELQTEFGGSAKAAGDTFAGQLGKLKVALGNVMEDVGAKLVPVLLRAGEILGVVIPAAINTLEPVWQGLADFVTGFTKGIDDFGSSQSTLAQWGAIAYEWFLKVKDIVAAVMDVFGHARAGIGENSAQLGTMIAQLGQTFSSAFGAIRAVVTTAVDFLRGVWRVFGDDIMSFARETWASIGETFRGALNFLTGIFDLIKAVLTGKWGDAWTALKKIVDGAFDAIFGVIRFAVTNVIPTILAGLGQIVTSIARTAFDGLKDHFRAALNWVIDRWNGLEFKAPHIPGLPDVTIGVPDIPRLASGGTFNGAAIVGEAGPELLVGSGRVVPNGQLGGSTVINFYGPQDPAGVARQLEDLLYRYQQQGGTLRFAT